MADSFTKLYLQVVFATKNRQPLLLPSFRFKVFSYVGGILKGHKQIPLAINGVADHIHLFFIYWPHLPLSDLVRDIKRDSSSYINKNNYITRPFKWQPSYGAFSYGSSQIKQVIQYIENQEEHHKRRSFREEYLLFLKHYHAPGNSYGWIDEDV